MRTFLSTAMSATMALVLIVLAVALVGCTDEPAPLAPDLAKSHLPFPATPEILMGNFYEAYGTQDLAGYASLLHPDFQFELARGFTPQSWGRDQELAIAARMFSREDYVKPDRVIAGIARIEFVCFEGVGPWVVAPENGGAVTLVRTYNVHVRFHRTDESVIDVQGTSIFHVHADEFEDAGGETRLGYRIVRWVDRTG
jgi:hypothetical protein